MDHGHASLRVAWDVRSVLSTPTQDDMISKIGRKVVQLYALYPTQFDLYHSHYLATVLSILLSFGDELEPTSCQLEYHQLICQGHGFLSSRTS